MNRKNILSDTSMFARQKFMTNNMSTKKWNTNNYIVPFRKYNDIVPYFIQNSVLIFN